MHILTKFLVVFAAVLGILLAGLAVAYTQNADALAKANNDLRSSLDATQSRLQNQAAEFGAEIRSKDEKIAALESTISQQNSRISDLQSRNAQLTAQINELKQASALHSAQIDEFTAIAQTYAEVNQAQRRELERLREKELTNSRRQIELTDRINDLLGRLEVAQETNRTLQEQIVELRDQIDRGTSRDELAEGRGFLKPPPNFRSSITAVREEPGGQVMVQIDAGSTDQLREDMKLMIVRDGFLANLILERVDENESVGRVDFVGRTGISVRVGDLVLPTL